MNGPVRSLDDDEQKFFDDIATLCAGVDADIIYSGWLYCMVCLAANHHLEKDSAKAWYDEIPDDLKDATDRNWSNLKLQIAAYPNQVGNA